MTEEIRQHYRRLFEQHRFSPAAVQQPSSTEQARRFALLTAHIDRRASIIDVGCGLGDLLPFLRSRGHVGAYLGLDLLPDFVAAARERYAGVPDAAFAEFDFDKDALPQGYDFAVVCGSFNNRLSDGSNHSSLLRAIDMMMAGVRSGIAFNALSTHVEYMDDGLYYVSPEALFAHIRDNVSKFVSMRHDYVLREGGFPYEFTMYVQKSPVPIGGDE